MKKFIVHPRALAGHPKTGEVPSVLEVEGEVISALEDPSVMWLPSGEFKFRIFKPEALYETQKNGTKTPPIYFSHSVYDTLEQARLVAECWIYEQAEFEFRKYGAKIDYDDAASKCKKIQEITL
jgi:hypothetical protein